MARLLLLTALAVTLATTGCAAWRIGQSAQLARASEPYQQRPADATLRLLVVGDSTAVGTGAATPAASVAGRLGQQHPKLWIENRAQDGATFSDVAAQLGRSDERFDVILVQAGGNDVMRLSQQTALREAVDSVARNAHQRAPAVLLMPSGNVGNAPFFFFPLRGVMTERSRELHALVRDAAARHGQTYINLFKERDADPFARDPALNARDGLHPSDAGYALWWQELMAQSALQTALAAAR